MQSSLISRGIGYADLALQARSPKKGDDVVRANAGTHLAARMGKLRGLPQKIGHAYSLSGSGGDEMGVSSQRLSREL